MCAYNFGCLQHLQMRVCKANWHMPLFVYVPLSCDDVHCMSSNLNSCSKFTCNLYIDVSINE